MSSEQKNQDSKNQVQNSGRTPASCLFHTRRYTVSKATFFNLLEPQSQVPRGRCTRANELSHTHSHGQAAAAGRVHGTWTETEWNRQPGHHITIRSVHTYPCEGSPGSRILLFPLWLPSSSLKSGHIQSRTGV